MGRRHRSKEYIAKAVQLCEEQSDRSLAEVARNLGVEYGTLYDWVRRSGRKNKQRGQSSQARPPGTAPLTTVPPTTEALQADNERLRRELEETKKQLEFAKKAAAFFAQQNK